MIGIVGLIKIGSVAIFTECRRASVPIRMTIIAVHRDVGPGQWKVSLVVVKIGGLPGRFCVTGCTIL